MHCLTIWYFSSENPFCIKWRQINENLQRPNLNWKHTKNPTRPIMISMNIRLLLFPFMHKISYILGLIGCTYLYCTMIMSQ